MNEVKPWVKDILWAIAVGAIEVRVSSFTGSDIFCLRGEYVGHFIADLKRSGLVDYDEGEHDLVLTQAGIEQL